MRQRPLSKSNPFRCSYPNHQSILKEAFDVPATAQQERLSNPQPIELDHNTTNNSISSDDGDESRTSDSPRCKLEESPSATTVQYYPGAWKIVLERAKNRFVRHVFLNQGFPVQNAHLHIAETILYEEIARGRAENLTLDNGKVLSFILYISVLKHHMI